MADQNEQPNFNSHPEKDFQLQPQEKRQNQCDGNEVPSSSEGANEEPKTITNIYYDCLERIFDFLDLESLLNVAQTCKRLQIAAIAKFGDDYGDKRIMFNMEYPFEIRIDDYKGSRICDLKFALYFLRCFGAKTSNLGVTNNYNFDYNKSIQENHLYQYINQYCAPTLRTFFIFGNCSFLNQNFQKQFIEVERVILDGHNLGNNLPKIINCFPNIWELRMLTHSDRASDMAVSIPQLEYLDINNFLIENAVKLLHANRQLQYLDLSFIREITIDQLLNMLDGNSSILRLTVGNGTLTDLTEVNLNRLLAQCPKIRVLSLTGSFTSDLAFNVIKQLSSLKWFEFHMSRTEYDRLVSRMDNAWRHSFDLNTNTVLIIEKNVKIINMKSAM